MILIQIGLTLAYDLVKPKPKFDVPDPAGLSDFKFPTVGEGRVIPIVWGTALISGPMVTWTGNLKVVPIEEEISTGIFTSETIIKGYDYYLTIDLVLCSGTINKTVRMWSDGEPIPMRGAAFPSGYQDGQTVTQYAEYSLIDVWAPEIYGGVDGEGGLAGDIYVYRGSTTQPVDAHLEARVGQDIPAYRGVAHAVMKWSGTSSTGFYFGTSPYIKDIGFEVQRFPNSLQLTDGDEKIGNDANPAAMIYDLLTSASGHNGLGIPEGNIDVAAFRTAGATLADEGLGLSMILDTQASAKDVILDVLRHVDGVVYVEPSTGLLTFGLVRFDYDPDTIPVLDETNCTVKSFSRASWSEIKNQVRVQYVDRAEGYIPKTVLAQNQAAIEAAGGEVSTQDLQLRGFSNGTNASAGASKALAALSYPLGMMTIDAGRVGWSFRPATVFKLNWPKLGISGLIGRVSTIGRGDLLSGTIEIVAIEDQFGIDYTTYTTPGESDWTDPAGPVPMLEDQEAILAPYESVKQIGPPEGGAQQAVVVASRAEVGISKGFNTIIDSEEMRFPWFTPSAELDGAITESSTTIGADLGTGALSIASQNDANFDAGFNVALIIDGTDPETSALEEFIAFKTVVINEGAGTITLSDLARGCLDTAPTSFADGKRIWFVSAASGIVNVPGSGATSIKFQPYNNLGGYDLDTCPTESVTALATARRELVYCPTDVQFNSASYPVSISGELTVSWEHRDRVGAWGYADSGETSAPESGTTYTIKVYGELGTLVHTESGLTGTSWTYLEADEIAESGLGRLNNSLRVEIYTLRGGVYSLRTIIWAFDRV